MVNKGTVMILVAIIATLVNNLSNIYVPEGFERPYLYKMKVTLVSSLASIARIGQTLNLGSEFAILRRLTDYSVAGVKYLRPKDGSVIVEDTKIEGIVVRIYRPSNVADGELSPAIIYFHGGCYVLGHIDGYDVYLYELSKRTNTIVISVHYRRAPEYPFPIPLDDCYRVTKAIFASNEYYGVDKDNVVLAGDSSGGHAVARITQRLALEKQFSPKLQILIYPWTQMYNLILPSDIEYATKAFTSHSQISLVKYMLWLIGVTDLTEEMENAISSNNFTLLIEDENLRKKYQTYLDISYIPGKCKNGKSYYDSYNSPKMQSFVYPSHLDNSNILIRDKKFAESVRRLLSVDASPGLADDETLKLLPKAYFISFEWDQMKDQGLIYAGRLMKNGVPVEVAFYEHAYHGSLTFIDEATGYSETRKAFNDLVNFINTNLYI